MSWLQKLQDTLAEKADKIPAGWWCVQGESKRLRKPLSTTRRKAALAFEVGILERRFFNVMGSRYLIQVPFYREIETRKRK